MVSPVRSVVPKNLAVVVALVAVVAVVAVVALVKSGTNRDQTAACAQEYVIENFGYHWYEAQAWQQAEATSVCRAHPHDANTFGPGSQ